MDTAMTDELQHLIEKFPDLHWRLDEEEHRYRAHDRAQRKWHYAKFSDDSQRWAMTALTEEALADTAGAAFNLIDEKLDQHLARMAGPPQDYRYDRSSVLAELSAETDQPHHTIEQILDTIDRLGIQPEDWRTP
jgi:hypothetical protein